MQHLPLLWASLPLRGLAKVQLLQGLAEEVPAVCRTRPERSGTQAEMCGNSRAICLALGTASIMGCAAPAPVSLTLVHSLVIFIEGVSFVKLLCQQLLSQQSSLRKQLRNAKHTGPCTHLPGPG